MPAIDSTPHSTQERASEMHRDSGRAPAPRPEEAAARGPGTRWTRWRDELAAVSPQRAAMVGSAAALGAVIGAIGARALRG